MDSEHLSLSLPASSSGEPTPCDSDVTIVTLISIDADKGSVGITLKCDLYERVLDPTLLPSVANHFVSIVWSDIM